MCQKTDSYLYSEVSYENLLQINGGIPVPIIVAIIGAGVTIIGGCVAMDMENAKERGANDAYNDMYRNIPANLGTPIYHC